jgi:penicillin-binding protein 1C
MGPYLPAFAVAVEDRRFRSHPGVDLLALIRAAGQNLRAGRIVSGGSTLTAQVVRLATPRPRTLRSKLLEFLDALTLEKVRSKDRILEAWLNLIPAGGNLRGVEAAALAYFGKRARELSPAEAALLIGLARSPSRVRPDRGPEEARALRDRILDRLVSRGILSPGEGERARAEPLPRVRFPLPDRGRFVAVHARAERPAPERTGRIRTTLDPFAQGLLEAALREALSPFPSRVTGAGILVDVPTGEVRAYVGNARQGSGEEGSWVDCGDAPRSPGSTLKPFVYGLAFDRGLLDPGSLLADTPLGLSGGAPRNFDPTYRGPVSARIALADSLNVPAVRVLRSLGGASALEGLRSLGFAHLTGDSLHYGDALILGGCEVTLLELARATLALARLGRPGELRWSSPGATEESGTPGGPKRLALDPEEGTPGGDAREETPPPLSRGAAYCVADILKDARRLLPLYGRRAGEQDGEIAFKTGTSYALRDAWTAAYTPRTLVVLWFGDPKGAPHPDLVGLRTAAPAALSLIRRLDRGPWFRRPPEVIERTVCALSGALLGPACRATRREIALRDRSPEEVCPLHRLVEGRPVLVWPGELAGFGGRPAPAPEAPRILYPREGTRYVLLPGSAPRLIPRHEGGAGRLCWFLDGEPLPEGREGAPSLPMTPGPHRLTLCDEAGNLDTVEYRVDPPEGKGGAPAPEPLAPAD